MSRLSISELPLLGLKLISRQTLADSRGSLSRIFCAETLEEAGWHQSIAQLNHTKTLTRGTVRGMHYQLPPHSELKLVSCIRGEIWDVVVDLRSNSPTFLKWHAEILSAENNGALLIPEGCAHGFQTQTDNVEVLYCHSEAYQPASEAGLNPQDPFLSINWPLKISELSSRDAEHPMISGTFKGVII